MELLSSGKLKSKINLYMKRAIGYKNCELECIYGSNPGRGKIERDEFLRILDTLNNKYDTLSEETTLDIRHTFGRGLSNIRATIKGLDSIKKYCNTESLNDIYSIEYNLKKPYKDFKNKEKRFNVLKNDDYNIRTNIKYEERLLVSNEKVMDFLNDLDKDWILHCRPFFFF